LKKANRLRAACSFVHELSYDKIGLPVLAFEQQSERGHDRLKRWQMLYIVMFVPACANKATINFLRQSMQFVPSAQSVPSFIGTLCGIKISQSSTEFFDYFRNHVCEAANFRKRNEVDYLDRECQGLGH